MENQLRIFDGKDQKLLLVIGKFKIFGISPINGEIYFEYDHQEVEIVKVLNCIGGCLLILDRMGMIKLIEIYYETGEILSTWYIDMGVHNYTIESISTSFTSPTITSFNLFIKLSIKSIGQVILLYLIDPLKEGIISCIFRHWLISGDDKNLPIIVIDPVLFFLNLFYF